MRVTRGGSAQEKVKKERSEMKGSDCAKLARGMERKGEDENM